MAKNPLRILLLAPELPKDGKAKEPMHILQEIQHLAQLPIELHVMTASHTNITIQGVTFHVLPQTNRNPFKLAKVLAFAVRNLYHIPGVSLKALARFYRAAKKNCAIADFLRDCPVDVIHSHWAYPEGTGGTWAARKVGIPAVMTLRGVDINRNDDVGYGYRCESAYEGILRTSLQMANRVTVASSYSQQNAERLMGIGSKVSVLPNGLDLALFSPDQHSRLEAKESLGLAPDKFALFTLGNIVANKKFDVIVKAMAVLREKGRNVTCLIGGAGPMRGELDSLIAKLGLDQSVQMLGALHFSKVAQYYAACDAFVFASASEGFGNVTLEAMSMARPVITTPVGMAEDCIQDGVNGLLAPFDDPDAFAEKVIHLMDNPAVAHDIGVRARDSVVPRLSIANRVEGFYRLYLDCCEERQHT
jgi:glycosyltransferase involved in cell wall biosynthesis